MNASKKVIAIAGIVLALAGLTACGNNSDRQDLTVADIPEVNVPAPSASAAPSGQPTTQPIPEGAVIKDGVVDPTLKVTDGDTYTQTVEVGTVFQVPTVEGQEANPVDIVFTEGENLVLPATEAPAGAPWGGAQAPVPGGVFYYADKVGVVKGSLRLLGTDLQPTGEGVQFTLKFVKK